MRRLINKAKAALNNETSPPTNPPEPPIESKPAPPPPQIVQPPPTIVLPPSGLPPANPLPPPPPPPPTPAVKNKPDYLQQQPLQQTADPTPSLSPPTARDIYRYRYHHGANLGSVYVLEKWLTGSAFPPSAKGHQTSELEACRSWVDAEGMAATQRRFEERWANALTDDELRWVAREGKCTSVRLPIGYFTLGPAFIPATTPFVSYAALYTNAWTSVKIMVQRLKTYGIGVLIDLHALPGGANGGEHSGTNSSKAQFWGSKKHLDLATRCLAFIATEVRDSPGMDNVIGIQLCNEAEYNAKGMYDWYASVHREIAQIDASIPLYISDAWDLGRCLAWTKNANKILSGASSSAYANKNPVVIDTHLYWCFSDDHKSKNPDQIIDRLVPSAFAALTRPGTTGEALSTGAAQVVVGEYACTLDGATWNHLNNTTPSREALTKSFGNAQSTLHQNTSGSGGSYFWTLKMDWMDGGDWGFVANVKNGAITPPPNFLIHRSGVKDAIARAKFQQSKAMTTANTQHCGYWDQACPGKTFEHWRFEHGWKVGFGDAAVFFAARVEGVLGDDGGSEGGDKIGCLEIWIRKRCIDSCMTGEFVWEFEQGMRRGVMDFYACAGV